MYNLAIARDWTPVRLPFIRQFDGAAPKTKVEPEYGIDMTFVLPSRDTLVILVLKDEPLTYSNWVPHKFDSDLRLAASPDLSRSEFDQIKLVRIILVYNKDEDEAGIKAFTLLTNTLGAKIRNGIDLEFDRWNLTRITDLVEEHLMTPDLLPQKLAGLLHYICSQIADFEYESSEWSNQLAPNWKHFLEVALSEPLDERKLRLIPVAIFILHRFMKKSRSGEAGWISLIETAMLLFWKKSITLEKRQLKQLIQTIWVSLYLQQLEQYLVRNQALFIVEHGFQHGNSPAFALNAIADANIAFWHIGRLGILTLGYLELLNSSTKDGQEAMEQILSRSADWLTECLQKNPASNRPLIDLHHIELFLVWYILWASGRMTECFLWLSELENRLLVRRTGFAHLPFIESRNRMDLVAEHAAKKKRPTDYSDKSSYLLLMILELCFSLPAQEKNKLIFRYFQRLVKGIRDDGEILEGNEIDLVGWAPPANWAERIFGETVTDGTAITFTALDSDQISEEICVKTIEEHVKQTREKFPFKVPEDIPKAALILGCIRHRSPLPSEFWRSAVFSLEEKSSNSE